MWRGFEDVARFCRDHSHPTRSELKGARQAESEPEEDVDASAMSHPGVMILSFTTTSTRGKGENYTFNVQFMRILVFHSVEIKVSRTPFTDSSLRCMFASAASLFIYIFFTQHITPSRLTTA